jgi:polar amino acid transport system substrate-binding protein
MRFRLFNRFLIILATSFFALSCDLPRDQRDTLVRVEKERRVRVGLIENAPWVVRGANGEPTGVETELARRFAAELGATPEWFWANEPDAMEALVNTELDLVVGGLTEKTLWANEVGLTAAYFTDRIVVGIPPAAEPTKEIEGKNIVVERDDLLAAALVAAEKATPVRVENISQTTEAAAARDWHLEQSGFNLTDIELQKDKHVIAVAPGENGFLVRLEKFLKEQRSAIKDSLQQQKSGEQR